MLVIVCTLRFSSTQEFCYPHLSNSTGSARIDITSASLKINTESVPFDVLSVFPVFFFRIIFPVVYFQTSHDYLAYEGTNEILGDAASNKEPKWFKSVDTLQNCFSRIEQSTMVTVVFNSIGNSLLKFNPDC